LGKKASSYTATEPQTPLNVFLWVHFSLGIQNSHSSRECTNEMKQFGVPSADASDDSAQPLAVVEKHTDALAVVHASNGFSEHIAYLQNLEFRASCLVLGLRDGVGHNDLVQGAGVDAINGVAAQDAMRDERHYLGRTLFLQQLRSAGNGVGRVGKIVNKDRGATRHVSHQHHGRVLPVVDLGRTAFLVDERKGHAERISDGGRSLGTTRIRTDHNGLLVVGDVELDVLTQKMAAIEVVHWDVEETLVLGI
jgi:hypothetical protein